MMDLIPSSFASFISIIKECKLSTSTIILLARISSIRFTSISFELLKFSKLFLNSRERSSFGNKTLTFTT